MAQILCLIEKSGCGHTQKRGGFFAADLAALPLQEDFVEAIGKGILRPSKFDAFGLGGGNSFCLALPYALPFVLRDKRKNLENNVAEESPDQILAATRVEKRHVNDADMRNLVSHSKSGCPFDMPENTEKPF